jgi:hypothetical protein
MYTPDPFTSLKVVTTYYKNIRHRLEDIQRAIEDIEDHYEDLQCACSAEVDSIAEFLKEQGDLVAYKDYSQFMQLKEEDPRFRCGITHFISKEVNRMKDRLLPLTTSISKHFVDVD